MARRKKPQIVAELKTEEAQDAEEGIRTVKHLSVSARLPPALSYGGCHPARAGCCTTSIPPSRSAGRPSPPCIQ